MNICLLSTIESVGKSVMCADIFIFFQPYIFSFLFISFHLPFGRIIFCIRKYFNNVHTAHKYDENEMKFKHNKGPMEILLFSVCINMWAHMMRQYFSFDSRKAMLNNESTIKAPLYGRLWIGKFRWFDNTSIQWYENWPPESPFYSHELLLLTV